MKKFLIALSIFSIFSFSANARKQVRAVGSSTVYPFITAAAEEFGRNTEFRTPIIEATGTGGGMKLFCSGIGNKFPDVANASRHIKKSEIERCNEYGIKNIIELKIGYDGIVLASSIDSEQFNLTLRELFLALATKVPANGKLIDNPYKKWSDINKRLPKRKIEIYGPPPTSGTRDAFVELVMQHYCEGLKEFEDAYPDAKDRKNACSVMREDGAFIEAGENDNIIVNKLMTNNGSLGIFGYSFLEQNLDKVIAANIDGVPPTFANISSGSYPVSRSLFVYIKGEHFAIVPGLREFAEEIISEEAVGEDGYLIFKGLIPPTILDKNVNKKALN